MQGKKKGTHTKSVHSFFLPCTISIWLRLRLGLLLMLSDVFVLDGMRVIS